MGHSQSKHQGDARKKKGRKRTTEPESSSQAQRPYQPVGEIIDLAEDRAADRERQANIDRRRQARERSRATETQRSHDEEARDSLSTSSSDDSSSRSTSSEETSQGQHRTFERHRIPHPHLPGRAAQPSAPFVLRRIHRPCPQMRVYAEYLRAIASETHRRGAQARMVAFGDLSFALEHKQDEMRLSFGEFRNALMAWTPEEMRLFDNVKSAATAQMDERLGRRHAWRAFGKPRLLLENLPDESREELCRLALEKDHVIFDDNGLTLVAQPTLYALIYTTTVVSTGNGSELLNWNHAVEYLREYIEEKRHEYGRRGITVNVGNIRRKCQEWHMRYVEEWYVNLDAFYFDKWQKRAIEF
ncbi:MAG: hypothetical protein Q9159_002696 [Coniocarpon cinnabarinum]